MGFVAQATVITIINYDRKSFAVQATGYYDPSPILKNLKVDKLVQEKEKKNVGGKENHIACQTRQNYKPLFYLHK